jgi:rubrerythrin
MVIFVDCAYDNEITKELENYLKNLGYDAKAEESTVVINAVDVESILDKFLKDTNREEYRIRKIDSTNFVLSKEVMIEDLGFYRCEMCGYVVSSEEELLVHRRAHGIQLL